ADVAIDSAKDDPSLIGAWTFDEGAGTIAHDSSSFHNDGTLKGGASWTTGRKGGAVLFDGVSGHVTGPHTTSLEVKDTFTVAAWAKLAAVAYDQRFFANGYAFDLKLNNRKPQLELADAYSATTFELPPGEWHHLALTFERGTPKWYVDGTRT